MRICTKEESHIADSGSFVYLLLSIMVESQNDNEIAIYECMMGMRAWLFACLSMNNIFCHSDSDSRYVDHAICAS